MASGGGVAASGGGVAASGGGVAATGGGSAATGGGASSDGGTLTTCPTTGQGAINPPGACFVFTPAQAGASDAGINANENNYALEPVPGVSAQNILVVQFNGSLGHPWGQIADPSTNLYGTLSSAGFHVLGLSYRSNQIVAATCGSQAGCYVAVRRTVVTGHVAAGAPQGMQDMREDEGIEQRIDAALKYLAAARPTEGWGQFTADANNADVSQRIAWNKVIASGHSQGGGQAAMLGQLLALHRVVQLSSTCDNISGTPAPWTDATATWATSPATSFVGFAAPTTFDSTGNATSGDKTCPYHHAVWVNMGMDASRMHDDAAVCGNVNDTHGASLECVDNAPRWAALYE